MIVLLAPSLVAAAATLLVAGAARRVLPALAAWLAAVAIAAVFVSVLVTSWTISLGYLAHEPYLGDTFAWCSGVLDVHHQLSRWIGPPAMVIAAWTTLRAVRVWGAWRTARGNTSGGLHVVVSPVPVAYAQTGPGGGIVISTAMIDALGPAERRALIAHEHAHLRHRHDRFLVVGMLGSGLPPLMLAVRELRHALERWADEDAAASVGDRSVVARAVARAALAAHDAPAPALSMLGACVPGRVEALLAAAPDTRTAWPWTTLAFSATALALGAATLQVHHLAAVLSVLCPG